MNFEQWENCGTALHLLFSSPLARFSFLNPPSMPLGVHIPRRYTAKPDDIRTGDPYTPTTGPSRPHHLSKANPKKPRPLVYLSDGHTLSQAPGLTPIAGQIGFAGDRPQDGQLRPHPFEPLNEVPVDPYPMDNLMFMHDESQSLLQDYHTISRHRRRRLNQSNRWLNEVIPALVLPYMNHVQQIDRSRQYPSVADMAPPLDICDCNRDNRVLTVMIVRFLGEC